MTQLIMPQHANSLGITFGGQVRNRVGGREEGGGGGRGWGVRSAYTCCPELSCTANLIILSIVIVINVNGTMPPILGQSVPVHSDKSELAPMLLPWPESCVQLSS